MLQVYLAGKAQLAFAQVDSEKLDDFDLVKETMLRSLGDTPEEADRRWWTLRRRKGETSGAFYLRMRSTANRRFLGILTRDDMFNKVLLSRFMALLPSECYNCISAKHPRTAEEAAEMVADYESRETFSKTYLSGDSTDLHPQQQHHYKRSVSRVFFLIIYKGEIAPRELLAASLSVAVVMAVALLVSIVRMLGRITRERRVSSKKSWKRKRENP